MMATQLLIDTDILIDCLRDYPDAVSYLEAQQDYLLVTLNRKHFPMLQDFIVSYHKTQHNAAPSTRMEPER